MAGAVLGFLGLFGWVFWVQSVGFRVRLALQWGFEQIWV